MKELHEHDKDPVKQVTEQQLKKQLQHMGTLRLHPGQKCWEKNLFTGEVKEATYEDATVSLETHKVVKRRVIVKYGFCTAINKKNAIRKFNLRG